MLAKILPLIVLGLALGACPPSNSNSPPAPAASPSGTTMTFNFNRQLPDRRVTPFQGGPCVSDLTGQMVSGTAALSILDSGPSSELVVGENKLRVDVTGGSYTTTLVALNPAAGCAPLGTPSPTVTITFSLTYLSAVENGSSDPACCVFRSRVDFSSFNVTGVQLLDDVVKAAVQDEILKDLDFEAADRMNRLLRSGPLPNGTDPRCPDYSMLGPDGKVR